MLYREKRTQERAAAAAAEGQQKTDALPQENVLHVTDAGVRRPLDIAELRATIVAAGEGLAEFIDSEAILKETVKNLYDGIPVDEVFKSAILSARALVEKDPAYSQVTEMCIRDSHSIDRLTGPAPKATVGIVTVGKAHRDTMEALSRLGVDTVTANAPVRIYKPGLTWPLDAERMLDFARGLSHILVICLLYTSRCV